MKTLKEYYEEISKDKDRWFYMTISEPKDTPHWEEETAALYFIQQYFLSAGKGMVFWEDLNHGFVKLNRSRHVVSTFLFGIVLAEMFHIDLKKEDKNSIRVLYLWFLSCLYHDMGYIYESDTDIVKKTWYNDVKKEGLDALAKSFEIKYVDNSEFQTYGKENIDLYLKSRLAGATPKLDHGIIGGLLLYDRLRLQFEKAWEKARIDKEKSFTRDGFFGENNRLFYSENHFSAYAKAADAIISHNIWHTTLREYLEKSGKMDVNNLKKINIDNTICFLLSLADTLEPIKKYGIKGLEKFRIEQLEDEEGCRIQMDTEIYSCYEKDFFSNNSLSSWIAVKVNEVRNVSNKRYTFEIRLDKGAL